MTLSSAYLLVSHGSRDPRPRQAIALLAQLVCQQLQLLSVDRRLEGVTISSVAPFPASGLLHGFDSGISTLPSIAAAAPFVETATLELADRPLHQQIQQVGDRALATGCQTLKILPLFLLPGVHVMEDIPAEVAIAQRQLEGRLRLELCPHLGSHPQLRQLLTAVATATPMPAPCARILLAHGSRRGEANQAVEAIATDLEAIPAYWAVPPDLETQVTALANAGHQQIIILPYFLFAGGITDAIAHLVAHLSRQFPNIRLTLAAPLDICPTMARLIVDLAVRA